MYLAQAQNHQESGMMDGVDLDDAWDEAGCFTSDTGGAIVARSLWIGSPSARS